MRNSRGSSSASAEDDDDTTHVTAKDDDDDLNSIKRIPPWGAVQPTVKVAWVRRPQARCVALLSHTQIKRICLPS
jgi:hypothetical protein